jgi:hypothetical protein
MITSSRSVVPVGALSRAQHCPFSSALSLRDSLNTKEENEIHTDGEVRDTIFLAKMPPK